MSKPTFVTFTITVADREGYHIDQIRSSITDAIQDADLIVLEMDHGTQSVLTEID